MPRDVNGNYTLPAGNPVVTATVVSSVWANTTLSDLATSMTNSLDRSGASAGMTGQFKAISGTVGAPGISFGAEVTSGIYRAAAGDFRLSIAAADAYKFAFANPTGSIGLAAVNGTSLNPTRSDATAALSQAIVPTWTGIHTFSANVIMSAALSVAGQMLDTAVFTTGGSSSNAGLLLKSALPALTIVQTGAATDAKSWSLFASNTDLIWRADNDAGSVNKTFMDVLRAAGVLTSITFGNATDNMLVQALDDGGTPQTLGWRDLPQNLRVANYQLIMSDRGKSVLMNTVGATLTIPANGTVAFPIGTTIVILGGGGGTNSIAITTDTLFLGGVGTTGTRTLAAFGMATIVKISATQWFISGAGVT